MDPQWYTVEHAGQFWTVRSQSPVCLVAGITQRPRHHFVENPDGSVLVWPHGEPERTYLVWELR